MSIDYSVSQLQKKFAGPPGTLGFARIGEALRTHGRFDEAIQLCEDGLHIRPYQLTGYLVLGKALIDAGRLEEASQQFERALRLDSRCLSAMRYLAEIMNKLQKGETAAAYYRSILDVEPWDAEIRALLQQSGYEVTVPSPAAPSPYAPPEDTFHKPDGMVGDVMQVNFGEVADFLPSQEVENLIIPGADELSLEDGLAMQPTSAPAEIPAVSEFHPQPATRGMAAMFEDASAVLQADPVARAEAPSRDSTAEISTGDRILGEDIEKRLDDIFSLTGDEATRTPEMSATTAVEIESESVPASIESGRSTKSMPKMDPTEEAEEQPQVTGRDIEAQLDKLFDMEGKSDGVKPAAPVAAKLPAFPSLSEDDLDRTVTMPIMKEPSLKETAADWIANQGEKDIAESKSPEVHFVGAADTLMMPMEDVENLPETDEAFDADRTIEMPAIVAKESAEPAELFKASDPEDAHRPSDSNSMEMVDGNDVAERLDAIFIDEPTRVEMPKAEKPPMDAAATVIEAKEISDSDGMVTGEEVAIRLSEIFDAAPETARESRNAPVSMTPMQDEDDFPEDEEMPPQSGAVPNVATVTLAEIYFQQGLREQALQIYRQLLDREPGNETVRNRITEIESSKPEDDDRGSDTDLRRPRPGLKVPKRKK